MCTTITPAGEAGRASGHMLDRRHEELQGKWTLRFYSSPTRASVTSKMNGNFRLKHRKINGTPRGASAKRAWTPQWVSHAGLPQSRVGQQFLPGSGCWPFVSIQTSSQAVDLLFYESSQSTRQQPRLEPCRAPPWLTIDGELAWLLTFLVERKPLLFFFLLALSPTWHISFPNVPLTFFLTFIIYKWLFQLKNTKS